MKITIIIIIIVITFIIPTSTFAQTSLNKVNQKVGDRFEEDLSKLAAVMEEVRRRKGITETRVAFGGVDTPIKSADYQITYAAEALAFQQAQKYSSQRQLKYSLEVLKNKILQAKNEVAKAIE